MKTKWKPWAYGLIGVLGGIISSYFLYLMIDFIEDNNFWFFLILQIIFGYIGGASQGKKSGQKYAPYAAFIGGSVYSVLSSLVAVGLAYAFFIIFWGLVH